MPEEYMDPASSARGSKLASNFTVSLAFDRRLYKYEIKTSIAHAKMLGAELDQGLKFFARPADGAERLSSDVGALHFELWKQGGELCGRHRRVVATA